MQKHSRLHYIDIAKGMAMLLVIIGHCSYSEKILVGWLYSFHMPLFFALSGFTFRPQRYKTLREVLTPNQICDVYVFDTPRGEMMIPALRRVVKEVDLDEEKIILDEAVLPEVAVWEDEPAERDE